MLWVFNCQNVFPPPLFQILLTRARAHARVFLGTGGQILASDAWEFGGVAGVS